ncbi:MaoC/PaaZ C-terminal domain-containing protein [Pigmentiphaga soli]|uniref:MaoC/PaaZ C-terminal domain-containing protein n=1 Tax=Pigmentiphaga soli TaxID=1007095 RepID=A0ABP8HJ16_9BURK
MTRYYEDYEAGDRFPMGERLITEADHAQFCELVGYRVPLFVDEAYARTTPFGGRICPSALVMSFSTAMTEGLFHGSVIAMLATDNGRFSAPLRPGDTMRTEVEVVAKRTSSKPGRGIVVFRDVVSNQRGEIVFQIDKTLLIKQRT